MGRENRHRSAFRGREDGIQTRDEPTDGEIFHQYVRQVLVPELRPGDIVVMDNLRAHKQQRTIQAIEEAGCKVEFLPPYSPDLNPIEKMWSKVKGILRSLAARTSEKVDEAIRVALESVTPQDAQGWALLGERALFPFGRKHFPLPLAANGRDGPVRGAAVPPRRPFPKSNHRNNLFAQSAETTPRWKNYHIFHVVVDG
ncbi:MAG: transposase [Kiritimatiellae bacterium]|nr:transposase [Kiritimatiellia bacterium]